MPDVIVFGKKKFIFEKLLSVRLLLVDEGGLLGLALLLFCGVEDEIRVFVDRNYLALPQILMYNGRH